MNFLTPLYALAGLAIVAPLVFHLVRRRPKSKMEFSSLLFLDPATPRIAKSRSIENWFMLLLRAGALLLLAIAFARPYWGNPVVQPVPPTSIARVILLDSSASMQQQGMAAQLKDKAKRWIEDASESDIVSVYMVDEQVRPLLNLDESQSLAPEVRKKRGIEVLEQYQATWYRNNWARVFDSIIDRIEKEDRGIAPTTDGEESVNFAANEIPVEMPVEIVVLTDLQGPSNWNSLATVRWPSHVLLKVDVVSPSESQSSNAFVRLVSSDSASLVSSTPESANPESTIPSAEPMLSKTVSELELPNDTNVAGDPRTLFRVSNVSPGGDSTIQETFNLEWLSADGDTLRGSSPVQAVVPVGTTKFIAVDEFPEGAQAVKLNGDGVEFDNVFYLPVIKVETKKVLVFDSAPLSNQDSAGFFLSKVPLSTKSIHLDVEVVGSNVATDSIDFDSIDFDEVQFVVVTAAGTRDVLDGKWVDKLREFSGKGGAILWLWDQSIATPAESSAGGASGQPKAWDEIANAFYRALFPAEALGSSVEGTGRNYALLQDLRLSDPLLNGFSDPRFSDFTKVRIWQHRIFTPASPSDWEVIASFDTGGPALLRKNIAVPSDLQANGRLGQDAKTGPLLISTFGWQPEESQLALSSKFVPLMSNLIAESIGAADHTRQMLVGQTLAVPPNSTLRWIGKEKILVPLESYSRDWTYVPDRPGQLLVELADQSTLLYAVNVSESESVTKSADMSLLAQQSLPLVDMDSSRPLTEEQKTELAREKLASQRTIFAKEIESNQDIWRWVLCGVVGLVLVETVWGFRLSHRRTTA